MKAKPLTPVEQLKVLSKIWGNDREGFVFLPWISGTAKTKGERRSSFHEGPGYEWPTDRPKILAFLEQHGNDDVYFAPCLFGDNRRVEQYAEPERSLWADLDPVDPAGIDQDYRPTIAWETSPGRYQGVWLLSHPRVGASWQGKENHRLTAYLGADPSGWDTTQLLRVPGRRNHKPDHRAANGGQPVVGGLLYQDGPRYTPDDFDGLPAVAEAVVDDDLLDEDLLGGIDRHAVWGRVRLKVSAKVREYMGVRRLDDASGADRSEVLWQIERDLADAGCTLAEIIAVIRPTIWNKYAGRNDEIKRLKAEAAKAIAQGVQEHADDDTFADVLEGGTGDKPELRWFSDAMAVRIPRPKWLVKNIWSRGGCGFISGDPKSYKSWMALDFVVSVATGMNFLDEYPVVGGPQNVLYLQEEDGEITVRDRVEQIIEGKAPHLHWYGYMTIEDNYVWWNPPAAQIPIGFHVRAGFTASDPGWQAWLADVVREGEFSLVVIDTLGTTAGEVDTDRASDLMGKILRPLKYIAEETGASIAVVHHNKKGTDGNSRGGSRMLGSVALHAWVDDALYVHSRENVPGGARVVIDRESKSAVDYKAQVTIPAMRVKDTSGNRQVWSPEIGIPVHTQEGAEDVAPTRAEGKKKGEAGSNIAWRMKQMRQPLSLDHIMAVFQFPRGEALKQLNAGVTNGYLTGDESTGWTVV